MKSIDKSPTIEQLEQLARLGVPQDKAPKTSCECWQLTQKMMKDNEAAYRQHNTLQPGTLVRSAYGEKPYLGKIMTDSGRGNVSIRTPEGKIIQKGRRSVESI